MLAQPHRKGDNLLPSPAQGSVMPSLLQRFDALDARVVAALRARGPLALRAALGVVFLWFGALKLAGASPVADLVASSVPVLAPGQAVLALGAWESLLGLGLLAGVGLRLVLPMMGLLLLGTFSVLVLQPWLVFQGGNPLLLTLEGEFVVKNLVLLAAGLVVGGTVRRPFDARRGQGAAAA
jgi:putative oxidoreductase